MESGKYYVLAQGNNLYESMTKEEILSAITQAIETHAIGNVDTGFVTTLKEQNNNNGLKFWIGSTAEYNAIQTKEQNCFYILTDDTELEDLENEILRLGRVVGTISDLKGKILLNTSVPYGLGLSVDLAGDIPISQYSMVSVTVLYGSVERDVLCGVAPYDNGAFIRVGGTAAIFHVDTDGTDFITRLASVLITVNAQTNTIVSNQSICTNIDSSTTASGSVGKSATLAITKITGIY